MPSTSTLRNNTCHIYIYIYGGVSLIMVSPGAPQEHRHGSRVSPEYRATPVARRTGAEPRRVPWWIALVRLGGLPGWSDPFDLGSIPGGGVTFCKADWASQARNAIFVWHTSAAECKQKLRPRKVNSEWPAGWLPDLLTISPAVLPVLRFG